MNDIKNKMNNIPFGNSQFQIVNFIANEPTPERAYRNILLQLNQKIKAMKECSFRRRRREIEIEEAKIKIETTNNEFEKKRLEVDISEAQFYLDEEIKLIEDCAIEIKTYQKLLEKLPDFSREEFEAAELNYWQKKLINNAEIEYQSKGIISENTLINLNKIKMSVCKTDKDKIVIINNQATIENN